MTKNSTLKGLALGAIASLLISGFTGTAANAVGVESLVELKPTSGTEYAVIAGNSFELSANNSTNANTGNLKFLVTDASGLIRPGLETEARTLTFAATSSLSFTVSSSISQLISSSTVAISAGDTFFFDTNIELATAVSGKSTSAKANSVYTALAGSASAVTFFSNGDSDLAANVAATAGTLSATVKTATVLTEDEDTTAKTYVVNTGTRSVAKKLVLNSPNDATRTVTVQAWVDQDDDGKIDSFENVSPVRTVTFVKRSEIATTTTMTVVDGDTFLTAKVKTEPVLNGQQMLSGQVNAGDFLRVGFTRQDATNTVLYNRNLAGWNDTSKEWSVTISLAVAASANVGDSNTASTVVDTEWTGIDDAFAPTSGSAIGIVASGSKAVTVQLVANQNPHGLRVGDKVTFAANTLATVTGAELTVASVPSSNSFTVNALTASNTAVVAADIVDAHYTITTFDNSPESLIDRAIPGTYTAQAFIQGVAAGSKVTTTAITATSAEVELSTAQSATVQAGDSGTVKVKSGTLTVPVTISVYDADEAAVTAGRPVVVSFTGTGFKVNDKTGFQTLFTDANGQVALTVTHPTGATTVTTTITAVAENGPSGSLTLLWETQAYGLVDLNGTGASLASTRAIVPAGSYTLGLAVMDQWFAVAPSADYRVVVTGSGVVEGVKTLTDGKVDVVVTDNGFQSAMKTTVTLQKLTSGTWGAVSGTEITTNVNKNTNSVVLGADGSSLYGGSSDLSSPVAVKALVAQDRRLTTDVQPSYSESAEIFGKVQNAASSVGVAGAEVTITGPASILFSNGSVDKIGSITVISDSSGNFGVTLYSTTAQKDTVITVTSLGKSATTKVTFTGTTTGGVGTKLVITAPDAVAPASTLQVKAKLTDTYGNAVASAPVKVSYTGPGIAFGALPTAVDASGELSFSVLLGGGDSGTITVVVSYDQNGDGDYADAKDLNTTKTIAVETPATNVEAVIGSFLGRWAVRVENAKGSTIAVKVGGNWYKYTALNDNYLFSRKSKVGAEVLVKVYIDGSLYNEQTITVK